MSPSSHGPRAPPGCLFHRDDDTGEQTGYCVGEDSAPEEPVFVPKGPDAGEGEGYLLSLVGRRALNRYDLIILDALDIAAGPVATVQIPFRLRYGFPWHLGTRGGAAPCLIPRPPGPSWTTPWYPSPTWNAPSASGGMRSIDIWRVQDGEFAEHWDELNLLEVFQQLGVIPALDLTAPQATP